MKNLYLDITSGISGDMTLALLINLGADEKKLSEILSSLINKPVKLSTEKCLRNGISCSKLNIETDISGEPFRHFSDIKTMIESSPLLADRVKRQSIAAFEKIAEAESEMHDLSIEEVHFHEIGAVDTIIDIVGTALAINELGISRILSSSPVCGRGTIQTQHGTLPIPAPATAAILRGAPLKIINVEGELTTPTGAAILQTFVDSYDDFFSGNTILKEAYSTGDNEYEGATNMLRGIIFESGETGLTDEIMSITSNIDDMTGENFGLLFDILIKEDGVLDVSYTPAYGKKNRPLYILNVLAKIGTEEKIARLIFKNSSTGGLRIRREKRIIMDRNFIEIILDGQKISVKRLVYGDVEKFYPEWSDCVKAAEKTGRPATEIYTKAAAKAIL